MQERRARGTAGRVLGEGQRLLRKKIRKEPAASQR